MKKKLKLGSLIPLLVLVLSVNGFSQECNCSYLNVQGEMSCVNKWEYKKDGSGQVTGITPYNGKCHEFRKNHYKIVKTFKDGRIISVDSFKVPYISWGNYASGDSITLNDLKKLSDFILKNPDSVTSWQLKKYDLYFIKIFPVVYNDSTKIVQESSNYFHGKKTVLNKEMSDYLKKAQTGDFTVFKIIPKKCVDKKGKCEVINDFVLYLKKN